MLQTVISDATMKICALKTAFMNRKEINLERNIFISLAHSRKGFTDLTVL